MFVCMYVHPRWFSFFFRFLQVLFSSDSAILSKIQNRFTNCLSIFTFFFLQVKRGPYKTKQNKTRKDRLMVVLTRWKSPVESETSGVPSQQRICTTTTTTKKKKKKKKQKKMRKSGSLFSLLRNCCEKAEMRVGNMRGVASLTLHQRRQQRWCGGRIWAPTEEFGYLGIFFWVPTDLLLGTYGLAFGHLRIFIWVPTYFHLGTYGL